MLAMTRHVFFKFLRNNLLTPPSRISKVPKFCRCQQIQEISTTNSLWKKPKKGDIGAARKLEKRELPSLTVWKYMTVSQFAKVLNRKIDDVIELITFAPGAISYDKANSQIDDIQAIKWVAKKLGYTIKISKPPDVYSPVESDDKNIDITSMPVREDDLAPRPPVVTIMGHVDHGKTTLLDSLRNSNIVASEAGGITQAIGAFQVKLEDRFVTFIDTPGHAAFSAMRNRGAQATDIVVLVVAADDGVMEQTKESINMAKDANVPIIVAINKIDKKEADIERTKKMVLQAGIQLEDFGGDIMAIPISALKATNLSGLIEAILTQAELMQLKGESRGLIEGVVLESRVDFGRGKLCSGVVQRGMLRKGSYLVAGTAWSKVRGIFDEHRQVLTTAGPSTPVEIIGWRDLPSAGDKIFEVESERIAKAIIDYRKAQEVTEKQRQDAEVIKEKIAEWQVEYQAKLEYKKKMGFFRLRRQGPREKEFKEDTSGIPKISLIIKANVDGSVESLLDVLDTYDCENQCRLDVVHYGVGDVSEGDIKLAETFKAYIYGFDVKMPPKLQDYCARHRIEFRQSRIIYRLVESLKKDIEEILPKIPSEEIIGEANVVQSFIVTEGKNKIPVAGSRCFKGSLKKDASFKLVRGEHDEVIYDGSMYSMRILKKEVTSIAKDAECGLCLNDFEIVPQPGDKIICYRISHLNQKLEWHPVGF